MLVKLRLRDLHESRDALLCGFSQVVLSLVQLLLEESDLVHHIRGILQGGFALESASFRLIELSPVCVQLRFSPLQLNGERLVFLLPRKQLEFQLLDLLLGILCSLNGAIGFVAELGKFLDINESCDEDDGPR